ncbi:unnamed protein product [Kluyveromyces dobzhanskii CBS 2104]|uniref:WGS project CCBQ000000000 data, contig 00107 n=1 Tax=Kluyveromyces dobzhanskii CBS 2104 TaxID=1427455 RepID=A0A0A8KZ24_9SACH|nr:unnamed protein product [Kluyveromyces dobzhanskii CBS 2104]
MVEGHSLEKVLSAGGLTSSSNSSSRSSIPLTFDVPHQHKTNTKRFQNILTSDGVQQEEIEAGWNGKQDDVVVEQAQQNHQQPDNEDVDEVVTTQRMFRKLSTGSDDMQKVYSHAQLSSTAHGVRLLSKNLSNTKVALEVKKLMIVTKKQDDSLIYLTREMVEWILVNYLTIDVYVDAGFEKNESFNAKELCKDSRCGSHKIKYWSPEFVKDHEDFFDLIITLGGDGTVLYVSSIFQKNVPPVMSFALGSLGFLTNFQFEDFKYALSKILQNKIKTKMRMRLSCQLFRKRIKKVDEEARTTHIKYTLDGTYQVLNELTIDRGPSPFISMLELYGDGSLLTVAQADGLIIASPTGSTAYSLSAGGSLVYPSVNAIAVTPICPHTLSFRPIILPDSMTLKVKVPKASRSTAWAAFDGKNRVEMKKGDYIVITASPYSFPTLEARSTEFIDSISRTLNWNVRESQKSFTHMLSRKNQQKYEIHTGQARRCSEEELLVDPSDDSSSDSDDCSNE